MQDKNSDCNYSTGDLRSKWLKAKSSEGKVEDKTGIGQDLSFAGGFFVSAAMYVAHLEGMA